jgi:glyoxylase-like metal-dependent hydrolase (beta-lactamase superfamily II)
MTILFFVMIKAVPESGPGSTRIEITRLSGAVYLIEKSRSMEYHGRDILWKGYACASIGSDGIFLVDNCIREAAGQFIAALREISDKPVRFIVNTHWHTDHTGANHIIGPRAVIIAHDSTREEMLREKRYSEGYVIPAAPREGRPSLTFLDSLILRMNNEKVKLFHFPHGHTPGDVIVYFPQSAVLVMGDTYNGRYFPRICGDIGQYTEQYENLVRRLPANVTIVSGHQPPAGLGDLKRYAVMLRQSIAWVRERVEKNMPLEAIRSAPVPEEWKNWEGRGMINAFSIPEWIEMVYTHLKP